MQRPINEKKKKKKKKKKKNVRHPNMLHEGDLEMHERPVKECHYGTIRGLTMISLEIECYKSLR